MFCGTKATNSNQAMCAAIAALAAATFLMGRPASAQLGDDENVNTKISLGGKVIMDVSEGAGGYSAGQRADIIRGRLVTILAMPELKPDDVRVWEWPNGHNCAIYVRHHLLVTVTDALADANNTTPGALARTYADRLREVLPQMTYDTSGKPRASATSPRYNYAWEKQMEGKAP